MKTNTRISLFALFLFSTLFFTSCQKDKCTQTVTYKTYEPVYMSYDELRSSVKSEAAKVLKTPGKIYMKGNYIFINEVDKGIHVIDNSNPSSPQNIAFINIPGNIDIAAIGNVLYADSYIDLLALDISNPISVSVLKRIENALPQRIFSGGYYADPAQGVAVDWVEKEVTEEMETDCNGGGGGWFGGGIMEGDAVFNGNVGVPQTNSSGGGGRTIAPGIGGSMARFTISGYTLYVVDQTNLLTFDISSNANPVASGTASIGRNIETIFPYKNHLFIGSTNGMFIYNIDNPLNPTYVSTYIHGTACDPVVVDDNYAYITLRSGTPCNTDFNQLEVVNIQDLWNPSLVNTVPMFNPHGLGIDGTTLFICDGTDGLKVYDATDVITIADNRVAHFKNIQATDVIPAGNNRLLMIGTNGLYQYDYNDIQNISLLSVIPVFK